MQIDTAVDQEVMPDRLLASGGYTGPITAEAVPADACANLFEVCDSNPGAHGRFDHTARAESLQWLFTSHRNAVICGIATAAAIFIAAWIWM